MQTLTVTIVQTRLHWHDAPANRDMFEQLLENESDDTDLIILPEMFTTGFTMDPESCAEPMHGETVAWMKQLATEKSAAVCGSLVVAKDQQYFNRFICVEPSGMQHSYDKRHLFRLASEDAHYVPGRDFVVFKLNGWRICPMICYDLRFPVWSRNRDNYDLLLYVANWPSRRHLAWQTLLRARAIENLSYVVGVNRVGEDGNQLLYSGGSAIINYLGEDLADLGDKPGVATVTLDPEQLTGFRERFAFHMDADRFTLDCS